VTFRSFLNQDAPCRHQTPTNPRGPVQPARNPYRRGDGNILPDETELVFDVTQMAGDATRDFDEDVDLDERISDRRDPGGADTLLGIDSEQLVSARSMASDGLQVPDEVELVYSV
jgi:hypothetical protein